MEEKDRSKLQNYQVWGRHGEQRYSYIFGDSRSWYHLSETSIVSVVDPAN